MKTIAISAVIVFGLLIMASKHRNEDVAGMEDTPVSADNIRKGVSRGWYTATLVRVNGVPAVRLSGRSADGDTYTDVFPVTWEDWQTLKKEGYAVEE